MAKASQDTLERLHDMVARKLLERIKNGDAVAADFANAIKLLKDNNINATVDPNSPLGELAKNLPFSDQDDVRH